MFETDRLVVRRATDADVDALLTIFGDPENVRFYGAGRPWDRTEVEAFIASYPSGDERLVTAPGIALLKASLEVVGFGGVGYYPAPGNTPDLLFVFRKEHWGKGLATELARAALAEAFTHAEIDHVLATVHPANAGSVRVLEKCGLSLGGHVPGKNRLLYRLDRNVNSSDRPGDGGAALARLLGEAYGLPVSELAPLRGGESAQAYRATTADARRWFVKVAAPDPCYPRDAAETERALQMTAALRPAVRAVEVVAPHTSLAGEPCVGLDAGLVTVFPFIDAVPLGPRAGWPDAVLAAVARAVGEIQRSTSGLGDRPPPRESFTVDYLKRMPAVLDGLAGLGAGARPGQRAAATLVLPRRSDFERLLRRHDELAAHARARGGPLVLCHTDLNGDNLLLGADGRVHVVDWDAPRLAPPEQDVRYLLDLPRLALALAAFEETAGRTRLDADVFGMYFHRRVLVDLAYFVCRLLRPDRTHAEDAHDVGILLSDCFWALDGGAERRVEELRDALGACGR